MNDVKMRIIISLLLLITAFVADNRFARVVFFAMAAFYSGNTLSRYLFQ